MKASVAKRDGNSALSPISRILCTVTRLILRDTIVSGIMLFWQAVEQFREFLRTQGHSGPLVWIVPADVVFWFGELLIRPTIDTETHAEQLFKPGFPARFWRCNRRHRKTGPRHLLFCFRT